MRYYITPVTDPTAQKAVAEHLKQQFGTYQNCGGVLAPPKGAVLEVLEALQTCNPLEGLGTELVLDGNVLPKGKYRVLGNLCSCHDKDGSECCWLMLEPLAGGSEENALRHTFFCAGNPGKRKPRMACLGFFAIFKESSPAAATMMDWRGVVNLNGPFHPRAEGLGF